MTEAKYLGLTANELAKIASELESENAKLRKFAKLDAEDIDTMSCLIDDLRAENAGLKKRVMELEYERMMMFLELAGEWIRVKQREMEDER